MPKALKKSMVDLILKVKESLILSELQVYVRDLRKVVIYNRRKCKYPKNYDHIVEFGKIIEYKDMYGSPVLDQSGNPIYTLLYGEKDKDGRQPSYELALVKRVNSTSYFTIDFLVNSQKNQDIQCYSGYYKPFGFSRRDLEKSIPIFEVMIRDGKPELKNSPFLAREKSFIGQKCIDKKVRNGELLYTSDYKKLRTSFSEIRDLNDNLELDKSLISVPIIFVSGLTKICAKLLTFIPLKLGRFLIEKENLAQKSLGYILFITAILVKSLANISATMLKALVLLLVSNKEKYGNTYYTMLKYQLKECWEEARSNFSLIRNSEKTDHYRYPTDLSPIYGTWEELNAMKINIEKDLADDVCESGESISRSGRSSTFEERKLLIERGAEQLVEQKKVKTHLDNVLTYNALKIEKAK